MNAWFVHKPHPDPPPNGGYVRLGAAGDQLWIENESGKIMLVGQEIADLYRLIKPTMEG